MAYRSSYFLPTGLQPGGVQLLRSLSSLRPQLGEHIEEPTLLGPYPIGSRDEVMKLVVRDLYDASGEFIPPETLEVSWRPIRDGELFPGGSVQMKMQARCGVFKPRVVLRAIIENEVAPPHAPGATPLNFRQHRMTVVRPPSGKARPAARR
jgi:hypothetical protein